jgi:hypothetical protein
VTMSHGTIMECYGVVGLGLSCMQWEGKRNKEDSDEE